MGAGGAKRVGQEGDEVPGGYKMRPAVVAVVVAVGAKKQSNTAWSGIMPEGSPPETQSTASSEGYGIGPSEGEGDGTPQRQRSPWDDRRQADQAQVSGTQEQTVSQGSDQEATLQSVAPGAVHLAGFGASASASSTNRRGSAGSGADGGFRSGQAVRLCGLEKVGHLNGKEAVLKHWDAEGLRWQIRMPDGSEKRVRVGNLQALSGEGNVRSSFSVPVQSGGLAVAADANKELEMLLLQTNWSAIYQLFHQRFGISTLERLERASVVKPAVEMTLSIVAKCFALLRSDPSGRLHCTPLHIAALQLSTEAAEVIVRDLPQLVAQTHQPSNAGLCPLHIAILCGAQAIVELLLEGKANPTVRTLHDICPLHLAATTSKEVCQLLLAYQADPEQRDVMGSTSLHYAAVFKQQPVVEILLNHEKAGRLACGMDQKKVTALHVSCALYSDEEEDMWVPLMLIASGAKPWQADVHGASPRELVPWSNHSPLLQFFEAHGDKARDAAQHWLDEQYLKCPIFEGDDDDEDGSPPVSPMLSRKSTQHLQDSPARQRLQAQQPQRQQHEQAGPQQQGQQQEQTEKGHPSLSAASGPGFAETTGQIAELIAEAERLRKELADSKDRCVAAEKEKVELEHSRAKCAMLEESATDQQRVFDELQALYQSERNQNHQQLDSLQQRHASQRTGDESRLESARIEARQESQKQLDAQQLESNVKLQNLQAQLDEAKAAIAAAEAAKEAAQAEQSAAANLGATINRSGGRSRAELEEVVGELEAEIKRVGALEEQSRTAAEQQRAQILELKTAIRALSTKHGLVVSGDSPTELAASLDVEVARVKGDSGLREGEMKALGEQVSRLKEEAAQLQAGKTEAEDKCARLALERQEAENRGSAATLKLETKLKDIELQHSQTLAQSKAGAEEHQRRAEAAEAQSQQLQPVIDKLRQQFQALEVSFAEEQLLRKKYHNQIQDMKGAIRVICRFRPMVAREAGDGIALRRVDAFTVECTSVKDVKPYPFDAVFDCNSTQEDVFADCKDLIQSAVDGYNVTIFAYGQTGAGKTHTMYGTENQPGLAPRSIHALFEMIRREQQQGGKTFKMKAYMIEVYKQDIIDLLVEKKPDKKGGLEVKKDIGRGMMYVEGVTEREIQSPEELKKTLAEGEKRRHVAKTAMNSASSRSHLLLSIIIEGKVKETGQVLYGKITLCDLAGSERPKKSEVIGDALKEAIEINKSLSALGDVIEALTKGAKSVPYRNHKLTMLMQDSLGGSAKTLMFVNCSPAGSNVEETQISLKWASRARQVTNDVKKNVDSKEVARLKQVITMMSQAQHAEEVEEVPDSTNEIPTSDSSVLNMQMAMNATTRGR